MNSDDIMAALRSKTDFAQFGVRSLRLFGSSARNTARADSDVDFLVRFDGVTTYDRYMDLKLYLEETLGVPVDLVTEDALRPEMRSAVEKDALLVA